MKPDPIIDALIAQNKFRYKDGMAEADVNLTNRAGVKRFEEVKEAQVRCTARERLARRLKTIRLMKEMDIEVAC